MSILDPITKMFWDLFPYSLALLAIPFVLIYIYRSSRGGMIKNRVVVFHKGGTKSYHLCEVVKDTINFNIDDNEYNEPIIHHPRITTYRGEIYRDYHYAEGIGGTIEAPPLTHEDRQTIIDWFVTYGIIDNKTRKSYLKSGTVKDPVWNENKIMTTLKFYNFDIEQVLDKPMPKAFNVAINAYQHLTGGLIKQIQELEGGISNKYTFGVFMVGLLIGFFIAYSFTLKGVI